MLALLALPGTLAGQQPPSSVPPLAPIGLPLAQVGAVTPAGAVSPVVVAPAPVVTAPLPLVGPLRPLIGATAQLSLPRRSRQPHRGTREPDGLKDSRPAVVFFAGPLWPHRHQASRVSVFAPTPAPPPVALVVAPAMHSPAGTLLVEVDPSDAQLFVDGVYVGGVGDGAVELDAGARRLEIRRSGYETLALDVQIRPGRLTRFRGGLTRVAPAPAPPAPAGGGPTGTTIYIIPDCYVGSVPPQQVSLPAGCNLDRVTTYTP